MSRADRIADEHLATTRRYFLRLSAAGAAGFCTSSLRAATPADHRGLAQAIARLQYLTPSGNFRNVERFKPLPYQLPLEKRREIGLERETWKLEIVADPESDSRLRSPLAKRDGVAQPMPRPFQKSGGNAIQFVPLEVK